jgi:hypothetical protein
MHKSEAYAIFDTRYRPNAIVTKNIVDYLRICTRPTLLVRVL